MSSNSASFYNRFAFLYPCMDLFFEAQTQALFREINRLKEGRLLEIGIGNGSHGRRYTRHKVTGIDTSGKMLERARKKCLGNIELVEMNGEEMLFINETFDYVVLSHVIAVVGDPDQLLQEVYRVLKPQGQVLILNHFTPDNFLRHLDFAVQPVAKRLHFRAVFRLRDLQSMNRFNLLKEMSVSPGSYFKIMIYQKA